MAWLSRDSLRLRVPMFIADNRCRVRCLTQPAFETKERPATSPRSTALDRGAASQGVGAAQTRPSQR